MVKSIRNMNTLNALIKDESMASREYEDLAKDPKLPIDVKLTLREMSRDELRHRNNLIKFREYLKIEKLKK